MTINIQNIEELSFESSIKELEDIVRSLESGNMELEKAIYLYERGNELQKICEERLNEAKLKIEKITKNVDGTAKISDFSEN